MIRLGLFGHPVRHSLSPLLHRTALQELGKEDRYRYDAFDVTPAALPVLVQRLRHGHWRGVNLTHPHKIAVLGLLDDPGDGRILGAVNTIVVEPGGRLVGRNTDGPGFLQGLRLLDPAPAPPGTAVLLGAGGAARAIGRALAGEGWLVHVVARRADAAGEVLQRCPASGQGRWAPWDAAEVTRSLLASAGLVVGCTDLAAGCRPGDERWAAAVVAYAALPLAVLSRETTVVDIVYSPDRTPLIETAARLGCRPLGGLGMLVAQAAYAFELWTGLVAPREAMRQAAERTLGRSGEPGR